MSEVRLIAGLGNVGDEYVNTRHNIGFEVIDLLGRTLGIEIKKRKFGGRFGEVFFEGKKLILLKPQRFMNRSGQVVATVLGFYKLELPDLLVVTDDMALEPGTIRMRRKGSAGGHNGLADIIEKLGSEEFCRLRVGIGKAEQMNDIDYVLGRISEQQRPLLDGAVEKAKEAVLSWVNSDVDETMNRFN